MYANHIFTTNDNGATFTTTTDVYQGAYYVYFPFEKLGGIINKVVAVNDAPQTGDFEYERFNHALHISALDFIKAEEGVDPETQQLTKSFSPVPVVNVMAMNATPEEKIAGNETLGGLTITEMQINAKGTDNAVFASKATIQPKFIPQVKSTVADTREAVLEAVDGGVSTSTSAIFKVASGDYKSTLTTKVENPNYTLTAAREVRAFALPIKNAVDYEGVSSSNANPTATVTVGRLYKDGENEGQMWYKLGEFAINNTNSPEFTATLKHALSAADTDSKSWQNIVRDDNNEWKSMRNNMTANLLVENFKPQTSSIKCIEQWNDLVDIYNALVELDAIDPEAKDFTAPTFKLAADVEFTNEIRVPVTGIKLETGSKKMIIAGEAPIQWPANIVTENKANIEVAEGATLNVGSMDAADLQADKVVINASIDNNGTIHAGVNASIGVDSEGLVNNALNYNKEGEVTNRVIVEYGAYVYPVSGSEGIVAYTVTNNDAETIGKINELLNSDDQNDHLASVNTLVIEGTTLDLNAAASYDSGSPYVDGSGAKNLSAKIKDVAIELNGGNIEKVLEVKQGTPNTAVASITAVGGDNTTTDVNTPAITVKDGTLTIESVEVEKVGKTTLKDVEAINNYGTIYANTNVEVEDIYNEGLISVGEDYTVTYSGNFKQENGGHYENDVRPATVYTPDAEALSGAVEKVMAAWTTFSNNYKGTKTYAEVAKAINGYASTDAPNTEAFVNALNAWLEIYYGNDDHNVTKATLTADVLILFENQSSERLGLTKA